MRGTWAALGRDVSGTGSERSREAAQVQSWMQCWSPLWIASNKIRADGGRGLKTWMKSGPSHIARQGGRRDATPGAPRRRSFVTLVIRLSLGESAKHSPHASKERQHPSPNEENGAESKPHVMILSRRRQRLLRAPQVWGRGRARGTTPAEALRLFFSARFCFPAAPAPPCAPSSAVSKFGISSGDAPPPTRASPKPGGFPTDSRHDKLWVCPRRWTGRSGGPSGGRADGRAVKLSGDRASSRSGGRPVGGSGGQTGGRAVGSGSLRWSTLRCSTNVLDFMSFRRRLMWPGFDRCA